jgi:hypothetical protein
LQATKNKAQQETGVHITFKLISASNKEMRQNERILHVTT